MRRRRKFRFSRSHLLYPVIARLSSSVALHLASSTLAYNRTRYRLIDHRYRCCFSSSHHASTTSIPMAANEGSLVRLRPCRSYSSPVQRRSGRLASSY